MTSRREIRARPRPDRKHEDIEKLERSGLKLHIDRARKQPDHPQNSTPINIMPTRPMLAPRLALAFGLGASLVNAIRFNISTPMQCEPLQVSWEDKSGDGDMRLLIMPVSHESSDQGEAGYTGAKRLTLFRRLDLIARRPPNSRPNRSSGTSPSPDPPRAHTRSPRSSNPRVSNS